MSCRGTGIGVLSWDMHVCVDASASHPAMLMRFKAEIWGCGVEVPGFRIRVLLLVLLMGC